MPKKKKMMESSGLVSKISIIILVIYKLLCIKITLYITLLKYKMKIKSNNSI